VLEVPAAIRLIESGSLAMDKICTHQLPLTEFQKGPGSGGQRHGISQGISDPVIRYGRLISGLPVRAS
jgi:hypothetical protein